jgi:hypothetical protein
MSSVEVHVNMDLCYSDSLNEFRGCFFNYQMNKYLSRNVSPEEYLKIFGLGDIQEIRSHLNRRHVYANSHRALVEYRNFCSEAFFTEKDIKGFFEDCIGYVNYVCTFDQEALKGEMPFPYVLCLEILEDLASIVYRNDSERVKRDVLGRARDLLIDDYEPGKAYKVLAPVFKQLFENWDVSSDYVGDDHGQRMKHIFCAQSMANQKSANDALARGFYNFYQGLPGGKKFPLHTLDSPNLPGVNCYFLFVNNPLNANSLEAEFLQSSKIIKIGSKGDFFKQFPYSNPSSESRAKGGPVVEQRMALVVALAAGKNFLLQNPNVDLFSPGIDGVKPFRDHNIGDWLSTMESRAFAEDVDWDGRRFLHGEKRPGLYIDHVSLSGLLSDENTIASAAEEVAQSLDDDDLPGYREAIEALSIGSKSPARPRSSRKSKRKRVRTEEEGRPIAEPLQKKTQKDVDPKSESDNSTILYAILGIGTFLGIVFLNNRA